MVILFYEKEERETRPEKRAHKLCGPWPGRANKYWAERKVQQGLLIVGGGKRACCGRAGGDYRVL